MALSGRFLRRWSFGLWVAGGVLAVAAGVCFALWRAPKTVDLPMPPSSGAEAPPVPTEAPPLLASVTPAKAEAVPPPGVSAEQWQRLRTELAGEPAELRRLTRYFRYADQLQRFRALRASPGAERTALAQALDHGLDDRLQQRELSAAEAWQIKTAVLETLLPDETQRRAALTEWENAVRTATPVDTTVAAREAEFQRRQAEIVAAWSAYPPALRDPRALERDLEALRRSQFPASR
jgi:hypothetical protein